MSILAFYLVLVSCMFEDLEFIKYTAGDYTFSSTILSLEEFEFAKSNFSYDKLKTNSKYDVFKFCDKYIVEADYEIHDYQIFPSQFEYEEYLAFENNAKDEVQKDHLVKAFHLGGKIREYITILNTEEFKSQIEKKKSDLIKIGGKEFKIYIDEGKFVLDYYDEFCVFNTFEHLQEFLQSENQPLFGDLNNYGGEIFNHKEDLRCLIAEKLNMQIETLDYSENSLKAIDQRMYERGFSQKDFYELALAFTIYIGEAMIKNSEGKYIWTIEKDGTFEPDILKVRKNYEIGIFRQLYKQFIYDIDFEGSVHLIYRLQIDPIFTVE